MDLTFPGKSRDDLVRLRAGHLRTLDDILVNNVLLTVPTARLLVDTIRAIDARIDFIDAFGG
jgi:hypothetical protein